MRPASTTATASTPSDATCSLMAEPAQHEKARRSSSRATSRHPGGFYIGPYGPLGVQVQWIATLPPLATL